MTERGRDAARNRDPRARFALVSIGWIAIGWIVTGILCFVPLFVALTRTPEGGLEQGRLASEILALDHHLWKIGLGFTLGVVPPLAILYRRMAGPMVRFRRVFDQVGSGSLPAAFRIRARDYLHREAEAFDAMLAGLRARTGAIRDAEEALSAQIARVAEAAGSGENALTSALRDLDRRQKDLAEAVAAIRSES